VGRVSFRMGRGLLGEVLVMRRVAFWWEGIWAKHSLEVFV
jgi:hypothetical protein